MEDGPSAFNPLSRACSYGPSEQDMGKLLKLKLAKVVLDRIECRLLEIVSAKHGSDYFAMDYEEYLILSEREETKKAFAQELLDMINEGLKE